MTSVASPSSGKTKKPIIHSQARELARKVLENCNLERQNTNYKYPVNQSLDRASFYTGLSKRTLSRIKSESKLAGPDKQLRSPKRKKTGRKLRIDDFDRTVIHNTITEFYLQMKIVPACPKLLLALREKIHFPWSVRTLQRVLNKLGYSWRQCRSKGAILIENPDIVFKRYEYLKRIREFRQHNRSIFYVDETCVDNKFTFEKCWRMRGSKGIITDTTSRSRLIVVSAGGKTGFLPQASLLFRAGTNTGDSHGKMNGDNFETWVVEKLLSSLPGHSVVVMDDAPYHNVQLNKPPTESSSKTAMIEWLEDNNISCNRLMRKADLFRIVKQHRPVDVDYKIDNIIKEHGHDVIRLPPYMCDLNPVRLAWAAIKCFVWDQDINSDLCFTKLTDVTTSAMASVTSEIWANFDKHVHKLENEYWEKDLEIENVIEDFTIEDGETSEEASLSAYSDDDL